MKKVLFVATVVKNHIMEFHIPYLKMFKEAGWETAVAARNDYENPRDCQIPYCDTYYDIPFERSPFKPGNLEAYRKLKRIIDVGHYDIIHCHTPVGAALTRLAARESRKRGTKVIYTAHGFHFYKGAPLLNWIIFYPVERWLAHYTDTLITINKEDYERAKSFKAGRVCYVPGVGVDLNKFNTQSVSREEKRRELGFTKDDFILLSVGELIPRKNHQLVLYALGLLQKQGKIGNIQYVICGRGVKLDELKALAQELQIADHVHFLGYRNDISAICQASDLFVFMSKQEGLPVAMMEAMACGVPVICSDIRGNTDLVENGVSGIISESSPEKLAENILQIDSNPSKLQKLSARAAKMIQKFDLSTVEPEVLKIYREGKLIWLMESQKLRKSLGIPLDAFVVLSVGEVNKNKNHELGIRAIAQLKDTIPQLFYVIVGRGSSMEALKKLSANLGVEKQVIFTGYRSDIPFFYHMADMFFFPSHREGLSVALMEAMASGLPVVCTKIRGNEDLIVHGRDGILIDNSLGDAVQAIAYMVNHPPKRHEFVVCARRVVKSYEISTVLGKMKKIYGETKH